MSVSEEFVFVALAGHLLGKRNGKTDKDADRRGGEGARQFALLFLDELRDLFRRGYPPKGSKAPCAPMQTIYHSVHALSKNLSKGEQTQPGGTSHTSPPRLRVRPVVLFKVERGDSGETPNHSSSKQLILVSRESQ